MTEAYTDLRYVVKFYEYGSHVSFNLRFLTEVNDNSTAEDFKCVIDEWIFHTPKNAVSNCIVSICVHIIIILHYLRNFIENRKYSGNYK